MGMMSSLDSTSGFGSSNNVQCVTNEQFTLDKIKNEFNYCKMPDPSFIIAYGIVVLNTNIQFQNEFDDFNDQTNRACIARSGNQSSSEDGIEIPDGICAQNNGDKLNLFCGSNNYLFNTNDICPPLKIDDDFLQPTDIFKKFVRDFFPDYEITLYHFTCQYY